YDERTGERGVVLVKYSDAIVQVAAMFSLADLASKYAIVLEPSSWGYQDVRFLLYVGDDMDVVVLSPCRPDLEFIQSLRSNLVPIRLGAGDWVDPEAFRPSQTSTRTFDVVMVAGWSPVKRHALLFQTLAKLKKDFNRRLRVALVGYPQGWTRTTIEKLRDRYGITAEDCTLFDGIPHGAVARIVADSRVSVLLSRREGASKALYESLFCGTPVIVPRGHRGVNLDHITAEVGVLVDDSELPATILQMLDGPATFRPREWALANTGWVHSTRRLNETLRDLACRRGLPWTRDIVGKKNAPNLRYAEAWAYPRFEADYERLREYLLPLD
ncbi:MAG: glycosyltransferase, partial [Longimicrobiales bacterium]